MHLKHNCLTQRRYEIFLLVFQTINHTFKTMCKKVLSEIDHFFLS